MNGFIFASGVNDPKHGNDATGAFRPGAQAFKKIHKIPQDIFYFDHNEKDAVLRKKILTRLATLPCDDGEGLDVVAYFGHGIPRGLPSAGFYSEDRSHKVTEYVKDLAFAIASTCKQSVKVVLYACSAGSLPHSFAGALAVALGSQDALVFGHTCSGHSFGNPYVSVFDCGHTGRFVIDPKDPQWKTWAKAIRAGNSNDPTKHPLWAEFPFMDEDEIRTALAGPKVTVSQSARQYDDPCIFLTYRW